MQCHGSIPRQSRSPMSSQKDSQTTVVSDAMGKSRSNFPAYSITGACKRHSIRPALPGSAPDRSYGRSMPK
jgi:hypothetical protein